MDEDIKAEIRRSLAQSSSAFNCGDVETILGSYAPDAIVLPPNSPAVQGTLVKIPPLRGGDFQGMRIYRPMPVSGCSAREDQLPR
jgi:hypothetical protein